MHRRLTPYRRRDRAQNNDNINPHYDESDTSIIPNISCCSWFCFFAVFGVAFVVINIIEVYVLMNSINTSNENVSEVDTYEAMSNTVIMHPKNTSNLNVIAYAVSLTSCGDGSLTDGGAVLKHSIHLSGQKYGYKMYAIVHPDATQCSGELKDLGYELLIRDVPVAVEDIEGDYLRTNVVHNGCCGEKEFIKLWAYTLVDHQIVVHLDLDSMMLKPMDDVFESMLFDAASEESIAARKNLPVMYGEEMPPVVDAFFTRDYNMNNPQMKRPVLVQGGFLVLRPSLDSFKVYKEIIRKGDFRPGTGWGGKGYTKYGAMTFQGIVPYFYDEIKPNTSVELSRCIYNAQADNPKTLPSHSVGDCRDGRPDCQDCRESDVSTLVTAHFTLCQKPWNCLPHNDYDIRHKLCRQMHHEWFRIRKDLEDSWQIQEQVKGKFQEEQFFGFCHRQGKKGYISMQVPK